MIRRLSASLLLLAATAFAAAPAPVAPPKPDPNHKPTIWLIGDSTVRNGSFDNGATAGQWGWGHILHYYFDPAKVTVVNDAMGGTTSKSFQESPNLWPLVIPKIQAGDYVFMQFGHNDSATPKGNSDETSPGRGGVATHTFGWYMRQYIEQVKAKGATPVVCSLIPRNNWSSDGSKINRADESFGLWAKQAADQEHVPFLPLNTLIADKYDKLGKDQVTVELFPPREGTHPNWAGAKLNAECVVEGIKQLDLPIKAFILPDAKAPDTADITPQSHGELGPDAENTIKRFNPRPAATRPAAATAPAPAQ